MKSGDSDSVVPEPEAPPLFREVQRFRQWIFWVADHDSHGGHVVAVRRADRPGNPQGSEPIPEWLAWVLAIVFGLGSPALRRSSCAWSPR